MSQALILYHGPHHDVSHMEGNKKEDFTQTILKEGISLIVYLHEMSLVTTHWTNEDTLSTIEKQNKKNKNTHNQS